MFDKAMDKLRDEMAKHNANGGIGQIGEYMTLRLQGEPKLAGKVLVKDKTLAGAFKVIADYAQKNKTGNFACVPPDKAFELVNGYYGIAGEDPSLSLKMTGTERGVAAGNGGAVASCAAREQDALDLDALLGD